MKNMTDNLRITNMIVTGNIPLKKRLSYDIIVKKSKYLWQVTNEEISPILSCRFNRKDNDKNVQKKRKSIYISVWHSGAINIVGVRSITEARECYNKIVEELLRIKSIKLKKTS